MAITDHNQVFEILGWGTATVNNTAGEGGDSLTGKPKNPRLWHFKIAGITPSQPPNRGGLFRRIVLGCRRFQNQS